MLPNAFGTLAAGCSRNREYAYTLCCVSLTVVLCLMFALLVCLRVRRMVPLLAWCGRHALVAERGVGGAPSSCTAVPRPLLARRGSVEGGGCESLGGMRHKPPLCGLRQYGGVCLGRRMFGCEALTARGPDTRHNECSR